MKTIVFCFLVLFTPLFICYPQNYRDSLIAYWSFEDSTARDFSGNGYHGTMNNNPIPCKGIIGGTAMSFLGGTEQNITGSHIILPMIDFASLGDFTMTFWVKEDSVEYFHGEAFVFFGDHHRGWLGVMNHINLSNPGDPRRFLQFSVGAGLSNGQEPLYFDYTDKYIRKWMFICMTFFNNVMKIYINGEFKGQTNQYVNVFGNNAAMARHWWSDYPYTSARFNGQLDEVKIFKKALTPDEVKEEYEENTCPTYVPELISSNGTFFCEGDSTTLSVKGRYKSYKWSNGQTCESITVGHLGVYSVEVTDTNGCKGNQSIHIDVRANPNPNIIINENKVLCDGDSVNIGTDKVFKEYLWESGQNTRSIYVKHNGWYKVKVTNEDGCSGTDSIYVDFKSNQKPEIKVDAPSLCQGDSVIITSVNNYVQYQWLEEPNETLVGTEKVFVAHKSGSYRLRVVTSDGCVIWSDPIEVTISNKQNVLEVIGSGGSMPDEAVFTDNRIGRINCRVITIVNHGNQTVTISQLSPDKNIYFSLPQGQLPITLEAGERKEVTVCFLPDSAGEFRDTIELGDYCNNHYIKLYGMCGETYYSGNSRCGYTIRAGQSKMGNITVFPNPSTGIITLGFDAKTNEDCILKVLSAEGRIMITHNLNIQLPGRQEINLDINELPSGPYNLTVSSSSWIFTHTILLIK